jgi:hypothetical protein
LRINATFSQPKISLRVCLGPNVLVIDDVGVWPYDRLAATARTGVTHGQRSWIVAQVTWRIQGVLRRRDDLVNGDSLVQIRVAGWTAQDRRTEQLTKFLPADGVPEDVQRWTAKRRAASVLSILKGETSVAEAARRHEFKVAEVEEW